MFYKVNGEGKRIELDSAGIAVARDILQRVTYTLYTATACPLSTDDLTGILGDAVEDTFEDR